MFLSAIGQLDQLRCSRGWLEAGEVSFLHASGLDGCAVWGEGQGLQHARVFSVDSYLDVIGVGFYRFRTPEAALQRKPPQPLGRRSKHSKPSPTLTKPPSLAGPRRTALGTPKPSDGATHTVHCCTIALLMY